MSWQFRPSLRLSVAHVDYVEMTEHIIEILSSSDRHQGLLRKSDGFTPNGGAEYKG